jgi:hypothetical protein
MGRTGKEGGGTTTTGRSTYSRLKHARKICKKSFIVGLKRKRFFFIFAKSENHAKMR